MLLWKYFFLEISIFPIYCILKIGKKCTLCVGQVVVDELELFRVRTAPIDGQEEVQGGLQQTGALGQKCAINILYFLIFENP
jgi:hypothetical protein